MVGWLVGWLTCVFLSMLRLRSPKKYVSAVCIVNEVLGNDFIRKSRLHGRLLGVESLFGTFAGSWADRRYFLAQFRHSYILLS